MKMRFYRIHLMALILIFVFCMNIYAQPSEDKLIMIRAKNIEDTDLSMYKEGDVIISKTFFMGSDGYLCTFFRQENEILRPYKASYMTDEAFDKAYYHWENDTTVTIRLINSDTKEEKELKLWGYGSVTGMQVDD